MEDKDVSRWKQKQRLRQLWKYYKVGKWDAIAHSVTSEEKILLRKYYGVDVE